MSNERSMRKVAATALGGTSIEWYDFFLYGTAAALVFPTLFFSERVVFGSTFGPCWGRAGAVLGTCYGVWKQWELERVQVARMQAELRNVGNGRIFKTEEGGIGSVAVAGEVSK